MEFYGRLKEWTMNIYFLLGCLFWGVLLWVLFALRPKSWLNDATLEQIQGKTKILLLVVPIIVILLCTLPMGLSPFWNGEIPEHRNQYEIMAESILKGHVYMDYEVDPKLSSMENPYDRDLRDELEVEYHWDHAFYNGHYYMYFGVVPVFLLFLPYRIITGESLDAYHGTQLFVAVFIVGIFALYYLFVKKYFPKLPLAMYLLLSSAFAIVSVWYCADAPALYTTASSAGLCFEIWSLFFFAKAVWDTVDVKKSIFFAFWGSLSGALTFGCRPPIALANLLVIPLLVIFLKEREIDRRLIRKLMLASSPYIVVGILLMMYNYVRFENPFEFGQAYQLTVVDQSNYGSITKESLIRAWNGLLSNFISYTPLSDTFPYISLNGALVNFPIFLFSVYGLSQKNVRKGLKRAKLLSFVKILLFMPIVITLIDALWAPTVYERSRIDIYWLMGLLCFLVAGFVYRDLSDTWKRKFSSWASYAGVFTILSCFVLWTVPMDWNPTACYPWLLSSIKKVLCFGIG